MTEPVISNIPGSILPHQEPEKPDSKKTSLPDPIVRILKKLRTTSEEKPPILQKIFPFLRKKSDEAGSAELLGKPQKNALSRLLSKLSPKKLWTWMTSRNKPSHTLPILKELTPLQENTPPLTEPSTVKLSPLQENTPPLTEPSTVKPSPLQENTPPLTEPSLIESISKQLRAFISLHIGASVEEECIPSLQKLSAEQELYRNVHEAIQRKNIDSLYQLKNGISEENLTALDSIISIIEQHNKKLQEAMATLAQSLEKASPEVIEGTMETVAQKSVNRITVFFLLEATGHQKEVKEKIISILDKYKEHILLSELRSSFIYFTSKLSIGQTSSAAEWCWEALTTRINEKLKPYLGKEVPTNDIPKIQKLFRYDDLSTLFTAIKDNDQNGIEAFLRERHPKIDEKKVKEQ